MISARSLSVSSSLSIQQPHGGDGTAYKERERAQEAAFILKREQEEAKKHLAKKVRVSNCKCNTDLC